MDNILKELQRTLSIKGQLHAQDKDTLIKYAGEITKQKDRIVKFEEAAKLLLEAKHIKETCGKNAGYEQLKERGWELLKQVMDENV